MEGVACLNMGAQNDGRSITPQVTHLEMISNQEYPTILKLHTFGLSQSS